MSRSLPMLEVRVPLHHVRSLTQSERYTYYMLGHMFNEMMALQKLLGYSIPKHEDDRLPRRRPETAQAFLITRLAASKIHEVVLAVRRKEIRETLENRLYPHHPELRDIQRAWNRCVGKSTWLGRLRNQVGFHYAEFSQWEKYVTPNESWVDDVIYMSTRAGNTFYDGADSVAMHAMLDLYPSNEPAEALAEMMDEFLELIKQTTTFLENAAGAFVTALVPESDRFQKPAGHVHAPDHDKVTLPFWTYMEHIARRKEAKKG